jgi:alginate O-acetyltransferase complex protein AlgI
MAYNSLSYLLVFLVLTYLIWLIVPAKQRPFVLLGASLVYYGSFGVKHIGFLLLTIGITWAAGRALGWLNEMQSETKAALQKEGVKAFKARVLALKRLVMWAACLVLLGLLLWLKYSAFFAGAANSLLARLPGGLALPVPETMQPVGISFYTLMAISYVVDIFRGTGRPQKLWQTALFLSFWPHIVEGPFDRCNALEATLLGESQRPSYRNLTFGLQRMLWGLLKLFLGSYYASGFADRVFDNFASYSGWAVAAAALLYTLQLYADFSGAIDLALGSAELFGISLAENFRQPFFAKSVGEFWRRWHISLGAWLREYVFQPFIMSKGNLALGKKCRAHFGALLGRSIPVWSGLLVVWFVTGLWHGAAWIYVVYGLYYFVLQWIGEVSDLALGRFCPKFYAWKAKSRLYGAFQVARTFVLVNIGMLLFRANGLMAAVAMLRSLFVPYRGQLLDGSLGEVQNLCVLLAAAALMLLVDILHEKKISIREKIAAVPLPLRWGIYTAAVLVLLTFGNYGMGIKIGGFLYAQY